jgi:hypothetical protein
LCPADEPALGPLKDFHPFILRKGSPDIGHELTFCSLGDVRHGHDAKLDLRLSQFLPQENLMRELARQAIHFRDNDFLDRLGLHQLAEFVEFGTVERGAGVIFDKDVLL